MESFGPICAEALTFLSELACRISVVTGDLRETTFLFQRLSIAINVLTVFYLKVLLLMAKMCRSHFYLNDLDQC